MPTRLWKNTKALLNRQLNQYTIDSHRWALCYRLVYFIAIFSFFGKSRFFSRPETALSADWLWPLFWLSDPIAPTFLLILRFFLWVFPVVAVLRPDKVWARWGAFISYFLILAAFNSFGKLNHSRYCILFILFAFCFLPPYWDSWRNQIKIRIALWFANLLFLGSYSMSGFWKIRQMITDLISLNQFPDHLASLLATSKIQHFYTKPSLINLEISTEASIALWVALSTMETSALSFAFLPRYQRLFGFTLIAFHTGVFLTSTILFRHPMYLALAILVLNPYIKKRTVG